MYTNWVVQKAQKGHPDVTSCTICTGFLHVPCTSSTCRPIRGAYNFHGSLWKMGNPQKPVSKTQDDPLSIEHFDGFTQVIFSQGSASRKRLRFNELCYSLNLPEMVEFYTNPKIFPSVFPVSIQCHLYKIPTITIHYQYLVLMPPRKCSSLLRLKTFRSRKNPMEARK